MKKIAHNDATSTGTMDKENGLCNCTVEKTSHDNKTKFIEKAHPLSIVLWAENFSEDRVSHFVQLLLIVGFSAREKHFFCDSIEKTSCLKVNLLKTK
ncbi:MAG: hypothetical protein FWH37_01180 [Candidatus Bathyarchaeota archaeon]|nr:hypothetical protein [Candidatus Termiticorpusculum sp.]